MAALVVMACQVQLYLPESRSLKDKRRIIKSLKERIRGRFNLSVAEVEYHDLWQRSTLALVVVGVNAAYGDQVLAKSVDFIERDTRVHLLDYATQAL